MAVTGALAEHFQPIYYTAMIQESRGFLFYICGLIGLKIEHKRRVATMS